MSHWKRTLHMMPVFALAAALCAGEASAACYGAGNVTGDGLRLRAEANTEASVLTSVSADTYVVVLEDAREGWYQVEYQGMKGYMSADYLDVSAKADADLGYGEVQTEGDSLNVRSGPGTDYDRVTSLSKGAVVRITGVEDGWFKVEANGKTGYVSSEYLVTCENSSSGSSARRSTGTKIPYDTTGTIGNGQSTEAGLAIVACAEKYLGTPYVYGGNGPNSFDCSGFVKYVFKECGYRIHRTAPPRQHAAEQRRFRCQERTAARGYCILPEQGRLPCRLPCGDLCRWGDLYPCLQRYVSGGVQQPCHQQQCEEVHRCPSGCLTELAWNQIIRPPRENPGAASFILIRRGRRSRRAW